MGRPSLKICTYDKYINLEEKDNDTLYFTNDTFQVFKGENEYTKSIKIVNTLPENGLEKVLYLNTNDFLLYIWIDNNFINLTQKSTDEIDDLTNSELPTSLAVKNYIQNKLLEFVKEVTYENGIFTIVKTNGNETFKLNNVMHSPVIDQEADIITFSVYGNENIDFKNIYVKSGKLSEDNRSIILTLNNGNEILFSVEPLLNIYTNVNTKSANTNIYDNEISVDIKVSNEPNNSLKINEDGLYVKTVPELDENGILIFK